MQDLMFIFPGKMQLLFSVLLKDERQHNLDMSFLICWASQFCFITQLCGVCVRPDKACSILNMQI